MTKLLMKHLKYRDYTPIPNIILQECWKQFNEQSYFVSFTTPDYILPNITDFLTIQNYSTGLILMLWNEVKIPPSTAFSDSRAYYV